MPITDTVWWHTAKGLMSVLCQSVLGSYSSACGGQIADLLVEDLSGVGTKMYLLL